MAARPLVTVHFIKHDDVKEDKKDDKKADEKKHEQLSTPAVLLAPIRPDIVRFVHTNMAKNSRQPYAVSEKAGHQHSAESWGTGRAVARVPRVSGGGTSRAGQGAFANMCRKGRMYAPTKIWRKWHRKINTNQKRFAVASALAASAIPALVMARGHRIDQVPEIPLVVDSSVESIKKTKAAIKALKDVGAYADVEKAKASRKIRRGVGKMRNRRHVERRGPLLVFANGETVTKAFRNLPGVETSHVDRLNLLQLAPGGHLGRFIVWTRGAFDKLNDIYGSVRRESTIKKGWTVPRNIMANSDLTRLINSDEVQSKIRPATRGFARTIRKKNPLTNLGALVKLNPYALSLRRSSILAERRRAKAKSDKLDAARAKKAPVEDKVAQRDSAIARTHDKQQHENYKLLVQGEHYKRPEHFEIKPLDARPPVNPVIAKGEKKKKKKKVTKTKTDDGAAKVNTKFILPTKLRKVAAKKPPKVKKEKKEGGGKGGKKGGKDKGDGKEAAKGEAAKGEGKAAPKEEGKKAAAGGEKGKKGK